MSQQTTRSRTAEQLAATTSPQAVEQRSLQEAEQKVLNNPIVKKDLDVLPQRVQKEKDLLGNEAANAVFTMLGPLGEVPEMAYDVLRDVGPTLAVAKPILEIATPILKVMAAQKQMVTIPDAINVAAPTISKKLNSQGLPMMADLVTDASNAPHLQKTLAKLASKNGVRNAAGNLTVEAAHAVADQVHNVVKKKLTEAGATAQQHAVVDAAHQTLKASASKSFTHPPPPLAKMGGSRHLRSTRRRRKRRHGPKPAMDGTGLKVMWLPHGGAVYRWVVGTRSDGRLVVRAPKKGKDKDDLYQLRSQDWGKETVMPVGARIHKRPSQTRRKNMLSRRNRSRQHLKKRHTRKQH
jgi:hypothetical protein